MSAAGGDVATTADRTGPGEARAGGPPTLARSGPMDVSLALGAGPLLREFNEAGLLSAADVHVAQRLGRLGEEPDEQVHLAVALTVRALRAGSVCVRLSDLDLLAVPEAEDADPVDDLPWPEPGRWEQAVRSSPLVAAGTDADQDRPLRWVDGRLYLDRYWRDEQRVRHDIESRLAVTVTDHEPARLVAECHRQWPAPDDDRQRIAAAASVLGRLTVITGGPGTGKTTTVARVIATLQNVVGPGLTIALAAPTGKAAARLQEAVRGVVAVMDPADRARVGQPEATTIHRLLGWKPGTSTRFRHDRNHHLPHDVVIVDETSMVSLSLMARLVEALRPDARLLLVGDPDQLASVEAGAVLGDLVARAGTSDVSPAEPEVRSVSAVLAQILPDDLPTDPSGRTALLGGVVRLERVHRHGEVIGALATAVRLGRADEVVRLLRYGGPEVEFVETADDTLAPGDLEAVRVDAVQAGTAVIRAATGGDVAMALEALESHRVLLAHRRGPAGVAVWAERVEGWVTEAWSDGHPRVVDDPPGPWYPGRPLLVSRNDRETGLYNGDTGVIVAVGPQPSAASTGRSQGHPGVARAGDVAGLSALGRGGLGQDGLGQGTVVAAFGDPRHPVLVRPHRLPAVETVYAMTVHRGQGSQFGTVSLVLPPAASPLLTRELFYTAVTRARERVRVIGSEAAVRAAVERPVRRASGLRYPLYGSDGSDGRRLAPPAQPRPGGGAG